MNEDAIDRKLVCAFIAGLISDDGEREKGLEYIRSMPPVNPTKTGWIPVSERLPDDYDRYLISTDDGMVGIVGYGYTDDLPNEIAFHEWDDEEWQCWKPNVTAWMPLPKPYEPQERSDKV